MLFEPLATAETLSNGTIFYELQEKEIVGKLTEEELRKHFILYKDINTVDAEEELEIRVSILDNMDAAGFSNEEWDQILAREFNTF